MLCRTLGPDGKGLEIIVTEKENFDLSNKDVSGIILQYPDTYGSVFDYTELTEKAHHAKVYTYSFFLIQNQGWLDVCLFMPAFCTSAKNCQADEFGTLHTVELTITCRFKQVSDPLILQTCRKNTHSLSHSIREH